MTLAVCLKCRTPKFGAFITCKKCGYAPLTDEEQMASISYSDHCLSVGDLAELAGLDEEAFVQAVFNGPKAN